MCGQCPGVAQRMGVREITLPGGPRDRGGSWVTGLRTKDPSWRRHLQGIDRRGSQRLRWHDLVRSAGAGFVSSSALSANGSTGYAPMRLRTLSARWFTQLSIAWVGGVVVGAAVAALVHNQVAAIAMACLSGLLVSI